MSVRECFLMLLRLFHPSPLLLLLLVLDDVPRLLENESYSLQAFGKIWTSRVVVRNWKIGSRSPDREQWMLTGTGNLRERDAHRERKIERERSSPRSSQWPSPNGALVAVISYICFCSRGVSIPCAPRRTVFRTRSSAIEVSRQLNLN